MKGKVSRWGNSLGVRIPKQLAEQVKLQERKAKFIEKARVEVIKKALAKTSVLIR